jgi:hypothetical protein
MTKDVTWPHNHHKIITHTQLTRHLIIESWPPQHDHTLPPLDDQQELIAIGG